MIDPFSVDRDGRSWSSRLRLTRCSPAGQIIPVLGPRCFTHAGPPVDINDIAPGLLGAVTAGLALEGERREPDEVRTLIAAGEIILRSGHEHGVIGPLSGVVTPRTPVWVVESDTGTVTASPVHEGPDAAMRSGQFDQKVVSRLRWLADTFAPALDAALTQLGGIDPLSVLASGINRGDEAHNRNVANSAELLRQLAPSVVRTSPSAIAADVLTDLADNVQGFLPVGMAAAKIIVDEVQHFGPPGLVTAAGANGRDFGIRVSRLPGWFTADSEVQPIASFFGGHRQTDAAPLIGDSLVMELIGLGVSALTAAPKLAQSLGADAQMTRDLVAMATAISHAPSAQFLNPNDDFRGTPTGIRVDAVVQQRVAPTFSIGYLATRVGAGRVGAGLYRPALTVFRKAAAELGQVATTVSP